MLPRTSSADIGLKPHKHNTYAVPPKMGKKYMRFLSLTAMFIVGIFIGRVVLSNHEQIKTFAQNLVASYAYSETAIDFAQNFILNFSTYFCILLILFFCAFCAISAPVIYGVILFKGIGIGLVYSAILMEYGIQSLLYIGVMLLPQDLLVVFLLILAANTSLPPCLALWQQMLKPSNQYKPVEAKKIAVKYIIFTAIMGVFILFFTVLQYVFSGIITLG